MKQPSRRSVTLALWAALFVMLPAVPALAAHPLITDDTGTQGRGKFQLEVNGEYAHDRDDGVTTKSTKLASTLSYGISDPLDAVLTVPYQFTRVSGAGSTARESGLSDVTLEAKWRVYDHEGLSLAVKPGISLPTGDDEKGLGTGKAGYHIFFIASKELKPWALHLNLGYIRNENKSDERKDLWHASLAATVEVAKNLRLVGNIGIERNTAPDEDINPAFALGGLIYSVSEAIDIDFGVKGGLSKSETDYSILAGLTYRF